jgi:hypothetical protein
MGDRHRNFEDPMLPVGDIEKTKLDLLGFLMNTL